VTRTLASKPGPELFAASEDYSRQVLCHRKRTHTCRFLKCNVKVACLLACCRYFVITVCPAALGVRWPCPILSHELRPQRAAPMSVKTSPPLRTRLCNDNCQGCYTLAVASRPCSPKEAAAMEAGGSLERSTVEAGLELCGAFT